MCRRDGSARWLEGMWFLRRAIWRLLELYTGADGDEFVIRSRPLNLSSNRAVVVLVSLLCIVTVTYSFHDLKRHSIAFLNLSHTIRPDVFPRTASNKTSAIHHSQ